MPALPLEGSVGRDGDNMAEDVIAVKTRLIDLGFTWLTPATANVGQLTIHTIRLFQAIKNGLDVVIKPVNDGVINVGADTHRWLSAANAPRWQQLPLGSRAEGFFNSEVAGPLNPNTRHDFGTDWLAGTIRAAGAAYAASFLATRPNAALLTVNDTSRPRGGNTSAHNGHESGLVCDLRLPRTDGNVGGIVVDAPTYDKAAMRAMLVALNAQPLFDFALLNDDDLIAEGLCRRSQGHDNHVHVEIVPPQRQDDA